jgi:Nucleotidyl transferase AbiEii toxin, Type IV TA system
MWKLIEWLLAGPPQRRTAAASKPAMAVVEVYPPAQDQAVAPQEPDGRIFDPAVRHGGKAFRTGDPHFATAEDARRWYAARDALIDHVLRRVARSPWQPRLALRGSSLMRHQVGEAARPPRDIDWMVLPPGLGLHMPSGVELVDEIDRLVAGGGLPDGIAIRGPAAREGIWAYERAEGVRLTFAWQSGELPSGSLQLDFTFGEPLAELAEETELTLSDGERVSLLAAPAGLALCWKLLWLGTDGFPQGKDLYDAVLLAERHGLSTELLARVVAPAVADGAVIQLLPDVESWRVDWDNFLRECPWVEGGQLQWKQRLAAAIAPAYAQDRAAAE